jgi:ABC-type Zn uptake system ZnuABC Zn-binding protein ZnuA
MNSQLFLIIVVIIVLVIIHRTSSNMPIVHESAKPVPVPVQLPQLENIFKNVLSNTMPMVQEPFNNDYVKNLETNTISKLDKLVPRDLERLKDWIRANRVSLLKTNTPKTDTKDPSIDTLQKTLNIIERYKFRK